MLTAADRLSLRRTVAVAHYKGGVGKTSATTNLAAQMAGSGLKILVVDMDPQGNVGEDLGYTDTSNDDGGVGLYRAITSGAEPHIVRGVRPSLDVLPGGPGLSGLVEHLVIGRHAADDETRVVSRESLARVLAPLGSRYDFILIDTPPLLDPVIDLALIASRWLLIPTQTDDSSRKGLRTLADRFAAARALNPDIDLLGILISLIGRSATRILANSRAAIADDFGGEAPLLDTTIPHMPAVADAVRRRGRLAHELEADLEGGPKWYERLRNPKSPAPEPINPNSVRTLADAYHDAAEEILAVIQAEEDRLAKEAM